MATAVNPSATPILVPASPGLMSRVAELPARSKLSLGVGLAALVAVLVALTMRSHSGEYRLLYPSLSDKDGGQVIEKLQQMNMPYRIGDANNMILVPADKVYELRMKLSAAGLPKGGETGDESPKGPRRRADPHDHRAGFSGISAGSPGNAEPERLLPRARTRLGVRGADLASGTHTRPLAARRHRAPGFAQRA
jgi:hypothetical protein